MACKFFPVLLYNYNLGRWQIYQTISLVNYNHCKVDMTFDRYNFELITEINLP